MAMSARLAAAGVAAKAGRENATTQNRQTFIAPDVDGVYSALGVQPGAPL
jgi:hypothetical protein